MPVGLYAPVRQGGHGNPDFRSAPGIDRRGAIFEYHTSCRDHVGMGHARAVRPLPGNAQRSINLICPAHTRDRTAGNGIQMGKEVPGGNILQKADIDTTVRPGHGAPGSGGITPRDFFKNRNLLHRRELRASPVRWHAHPKNAGLNQILDHVGRKLPSPLNLIRSGTECVTQRPGIIDNVWCPAYACLESLLPVGPQGHRVIGHLRSADHMPNAEAGKRRRHQIGGRTESTRNAHCMMSGHTRHGSGNSTLTLILED